MKSFFVRKNIKSLLLSNKRKFIIAQDIISLYYNYHYIYSFISQLGRNAETASACMWKKGGRGKKNFKGYSIFLNL